MNVDLGLKRTAIISYAHSDPRWSVLQTEEHSQHVLRFAQALRQYGIVTDVDKYHQNEDWTRWGPERVSSSDFVLIIVSQAWKDVWQGTGDTHLNKGLRAEADALRSIEHEGGGALQRRCRLILLPGSDEAAIPNGMHGIKRYPLEAFEKSDLEDLLRDLTDQPKHPMPPVGPVPVLPPAMSALPIEAHYDRDPASSGFGATPIAAQEKSDAPPERDKGIAAFDHMRRSGIIASHVAGESQARITRLLKQLAALPQPLPEDGPHLPWFRTRNKIESQLHAEIQTANETGALVDPEVWVTTRFIWPNPPDAYKDCGVEITSSDLAAGVITVASGFPGERGTYRRINSDMALTINPHDPLPTFLHESYEAHIETWMKKISDLSQEVPVSAEVRDAVKQLVATRVAAVPNSIWGSAIFTSTEDAPGGGLVVIGRCVFLTPR